MGRLNASAPKPNSSTVSPADFARQWVLEAYASQNANFGLKRAFSAWREIRPGTWLRLLIELCDVWWGNLTALWRPLGAWALSVVEPTVCGQATFLQAYGNSDGQMRLPTQGAIRVDAVRFGKVREMCLRARSPEEAAQVEQLGARLRNLREALGCSRIELAQYLRLDLEVIVAVENGYGNLETARRLIELAAKIPPANSVPV